MWHKNLSLDNLSEEINGVLYIEEWRNIIEWEDKYQISSFGRVKSKARFHDCYRGKNGVAWHKEKILKQNESGKGYMGVLLYSKERQQRGLIQRLVAIAFIENINNKPTVNHIDGNKLKNNFQNLEWATHKEQQVHAIKNNLRNKTLGENSNLSKLKEEQVIAIRKVFDTKKLSFKKISKMFNVSATLVGYIGNRQIWKHI